MHGRPFVKALQIICTMPNNSHITLQKSFHKDEQKGVGLDDIENSAL